MLLLPKEQRVNSYIFATDIVEYEGTDEVERLVDNVEYFQIDLQ